jgi:hypothetical protein
MPAILGESPGRVFRAENAGEPEHDVRVGAFARAREESKWYASRVPVVRVHGLDDLPGPAAARFRGSRRAAASGASSEVMAVSIWMGSPGGAEAHGGRRPRRSSSSMFLRGALSGFPSAGLQTISGRCRVWC